MTGLIAAALVATFAAQAPQPDAVPVVDLGWRKAALTWPGTPGPIQPGTPSLEVGEFKWETDRGGLGRRYLVDGGWQDVASLYAKLDANRTAPVWHVRAIVHTRAALIDRAGTVSQRRSSLERRQLNELADALARFKALVEVETRGAVKVEIQASLDEDLLLYDLTREGVLDTGAGGRVLPSVGEHLLADATWLVNDDPFDTDDKVYRGPYESVFVFHPALWAGEDPSSGPLTVVNFYRLASLGTQEALPRFLLAAWRGHVRAGAGRNGARLGVDDAFDPEASLVDARVAPGTALTALRSPANEAAYNALRFGAPEAPQPATAEQLAQDPWKLVAPQPALDAEPSESRPVHQAGALAAFAGGQVTLRGLATDQAQAWADWPELQAPSTAPPQPLLPRAWGSFEVKEAVLDGQPGFVVTDSGLFRGGAAALARWSEPQRGWLSARVRTSGDDGLALQLVGPNGQWLKRVVLSGAWSAVSEMPDATYAIEDARERGEGFRTVWVNLADTPTSELRVTPAPYGEFRERVGVGPSALEISAIRVSEEGPGIVMKEPPQPLAPQVAPTEAIADSNPEVQLVGLAALAQSPDPTTVPTLAKLAMSPNPATSYLAMRALQAAATPEAQLAIVRAAERPTFDHVERFAALCTPNEQAVAVGGILARLFGSSSWQSARTAAHTLERLGTRESRLILMTFLLRGDSRVRATAAAALDPNQPMEAGKLLYHAVNDTSQQVRSLCYRALLRSTLPDARAEGQKGVRDEAVGVRLDLLAEMLARKSADDRQAIRLAVVDRSPRVRAAALRALAAQPGDVVVGEFQNTLNDPDARVQRSLAELAQAKRIALPIATRQALLNSLDPDVRRLAEGLPG